MTVIILKNIWTYKYIINENQDNKPSKQQFYNHELSQQIKEVKNEVACWRIYVD